MMFLYFENTKKEPNNGLFSVLCKRTLFGSIKVNHLKWFGKILNDLIFKKGN